ncbi:MAG: complex I subunit 1 family protein [Candidatus Eisenbacteria bacterium]
MRSSFRSSSPSSPRSSRSSSCPCSSGRSGRSRPSSRTGPVRTGRRSSASGSAGLIHPFADVVKLLTKEDMTPSRVNRFYYNLGALLALSVPMLPFAIIPLADSLEIGGRMIEIRALTLDAGILYILAITSFHVYAVVLAGWSSNNTYTLIGGLRSAAQMVSYEIGLGLSLIGVLMISQTVDLGEIVRQQGGLLFGFLPRWNVFLQPLGFLIFLIAIFAETNRNPFDLAEGESEIIGFHVEYSSMRFALFFMGEYAAMVVGSAAIATIYFGGYQVPWLPTETLRENAPLVARAALGATALFCTVAALLFRSYDRRLMGLYRDRRRREARVLGMVCFFLAAASLILLAFLSALSPLGAQILTAVVQFLFLVVKISVFAFLFIWVRWTLPRFRYDQLMGLGWKSLMPLALINIAATGIVLVLWGRG